MRKFVFGIVLVSVLFSCKDAKEKKAVKNPISAKDTVAEIAVSENSVEQEVFKSDFEILLPRSYRTYDNENPASLLNQKWIELYQENEEYYLGNPSYKIEKGFDECSGDSLISIIPENKALIFIDNPELKAGKINSLKIKKHKIWPNEKVNFTFNNVNYILRAEGKVLSENNAVSNDNEDEVFKEVAHYKLFITAGNNAEKLLLAEESFHDTFVELLFAGDIDGDGKLDFVFGASRDYEEERVVLFLSSRAEKGEAVKKVSEIAVQFDC